MQVRRIPEAKRALVVQLRARGLSIRQIVQASGVSRSTVARLVQGLEIEPETAPVLADTNRPVGRCARCGRLVRLPCYACMLETADARKRECWRAQFGQLSQGERHAAD